MSGANIGDAFLLMPDGKVVDVTSREIARLRREPAVMFRTYIKNAEVTHLEFVLVQGFEARRTTSAKSVHRPIYVYLRAVRRLVAFPDPDQWERVPLVK